MRTHYLRRLVRSLIGCLGILGAVLPVPGWAQTKPVMV
jgi:hypothetical protein